MFNKDMLCLIEKGWLTVEWFMYDSFVMYYTVILITMHKV